jgi:hypothetical protein
MKISTPNARQAWHSHPTTPPHSQKKKKKTHNLLVLLMFFPSHVFLCHAAHAALDVLIQLPNKAVFLKKKKKKILCNKIIRLQKKKSVSKE